MPQDPSPNHYPHRHLLGIEGLSRPDIVALLNLAEDAIEVSRQVEKKRSNLRGRTQINLFYEASTRTQASFEIAGKRLRRRCYEYVGRAILGKQGRDADRHGHDSQRHASRFFMAKAFPAKAICSISR